MTLNPLPQDTIHNAQTPEGISFELHPAGIPARACALLIDGSISSLILLALTAVLSSVAHITGNWIMMLCWFAVTWFYYVLFELLNRGQTPGKRILGLRVVRSDGSPVDAGASFLRNLLRSADSFLSLYIIAFLTMALSPGFRRLGDWAADTLVVYTLPSEVPVRSTRQNWSSSLEPLSPPRPLSYAEKQSILDFARRYPLLGRARSNELAEPFVAFLRGQNDVALPPADYLLSLSLALNGGKL